MYTTSWLENFIWPVGALPLLGKCEWNETLLPLCSWDTCLWLEMKYLLLDEYIFLYDAFSQIQWQKIHKKEYQNKILQTSHVHHIIMK